MRAGWAAIATLIWLMVVGTFGVGGDEWAVLDTPTPTGIVFLMQADDEPVLPPGDDVPDRTAVVHHTPVAANPARPILPPEPASEPSPITATVAEPPDAPARGIDTPPG